MTSKRGTKALHDAGFKDLEIEKGIYGFYLRDPLLSAQRGSVVKKTYQECIELAKQGKRPQKWDNN